jgi:ATP-dependent RNA helicase DeaD
VGRRHRVEPRQIVGALANEGGLGRDDFGAINIRPDFSIVELPANLDPAVLDKLRDTRISGRLIEIAPDRGPGARRGSSSRDGEGRGRPARYDRTDRRDRDDRPAPRDRDRDREEKPFRKPRHKA